ncbi:hypothetical protein ATANTOWER_016396 [Ataeniobius toweri]|uniref:Uncharacterized protein n=1 Tax=Ataeniobius toweri TaxID=208326 RepID=A0ABU7AQ19_9TELE|nr:hypothetical protein [Ataeniobius toweri]
MRAERRRSLRALSHNKPVPLLSNTQFISVSDGAGVLRCAGGHVRLILLIAWRSTLAGGCQLFDARVFAYCD